MRSLVLGLATVYWTTLTLLYYQLQPLSFSSCCLASPWKQLYTSSGVRQWELRDCDNDVSDVDKTFPSEPWWYGWYGSVQICVQVAD